LAIHLNPATRHPEGSHANCKVFRHSFREAEGSAPLHCRTIQDCLDDRLLLRVAEQILRLASGAW